MSLRVVSSLLIGYAFGWLVAYAIIVGPKPDLVLAYVRWAWTGGGELPALIQLIAISTALLFAGYSFVRQRHKRH
jgi:hypothetical protein